MFFSCYAYGENFCTSCHHSHYTEVSSCVGCHRGVDSTSRKDLAHYMIIPGKYAGFYTDQNKLQQGKDLADKAKCRRCHILGNLGATKASNLNSSAKRLTADKLAEAIKIPNDNMPDFMFSDKQLESIITAIYGYSFEYDSVSVTQTVNFQDRNPNDVFTAKCGGCHKGLLTDGAKGAYSHGPNLSGLTEDNAFYINGEKWTPQLLEKWLQNPRSVKKHTHMPPIDLTEEEINILVKSLTDNPQQENDRR